ncbi:MAG: Rho termination factor N-terminal domain-containing protein [Deltaproteobacteria bacterium]|nr:Rho termination factor N-terminal domain-containing protein [Deltaproteobacteria bacterium]MBW2284849.1 Rho termination factor N-terminal domain-containing protein [Deltaproteobacteria bacterium]
MAEEIKNEETREATEESEEVHEEKQEAVAEEKPLDKMTVKELREIGKEIPDLSGVTAMKKDELLAAIKKARGIEEEAPPAKEKKVKAAKGKVDVKALKGKIIQLKEERAKARQDKNKAWVDVLRRRINRLKKRTRKVA